MLKAKELKASREVRVNGRSTSIRIIKEREDGYMEIYLGDGASIIEVPSDNLLVLWNGVPVLC